MATNSGNVKENLAIGKISNVKYQIFSVPNMEKEISTAF